MIRLNGMRWVLGLMLFAGGFSAAEEEGEYWEDGFETEFPDCCRRDSWWNKPLFCVTECCEPVWGEWFVEAPPLMRPFIADPRQVTYSAGWRFNDQVLVKNVIPVSFGDSIFLYRWHNVWPWCGELQIELEGAVWAVFDPLHDSSPLINADYYVGVPITYAIDNWQFRLRGYHISSHIGDEFLLNHPFFFRRNPSAEYLDFFVSHDLTNGIRIYGGLGVIMHQDESFRCHRFYADLGGEVRVWGLGFYDECQHLYGVPIFAVYMRHKGDFERHIDMTYALGYELGKTVCLERRVRAYLEYHDGYSVEGQFSKFPTNYFAIRLTYGF